MFTGLIEATGRVLNMKSRGEQARLTIANPFVGEITLGESIAVNGCCLTVSACDKSTTSFDF
jgi:riboflavin synthase